MDAVDAVDAVDVDIEIEHAELQVNRVQKLQEDLQHTKWMEHFHAIRQELHEKAVEAAAMLAKYDRLANLWRGLDFNLTMILQRLPEEERQASLRQEEEQRRWLAAAVPEVPEAPEVPVAEQTIPASLRNPTSIPELIARLDNPVQVQVLQRLLLRHDNNQMYLSAYEANPVMAGRAAEAEGTFTILGTMRKGTRESYSVKWYRLATSKPSFWCNCPDHKFNSTKKNMMCKHICFLVTKVGRILDPAFFETKRFTAEQHEAFRTIVGNAAIFADGTRERQRLAALPIYPTFPTSASSSNREARRATFLECRKPVEAEDSCPICYDTMVDTACLNCPTCSNNVHRECMEVWLERHTTCVFCRSDVWRAWK